MMNPMMKKFVDQEFMTEEEAKIISEAIENKDSVIAAGHRSAGIRPFMATLMMVASRAHSAVQVKGEEDLSKEGDYLLIPGIDGIDFEDLIYKAILQEDKGMITLKEPEHPYSLFKIMRKAYKENKNTDKVYYLVECDKENDVPFVKKITKVSQNEKGKTIKEDL
ncbi:MAG: hypothetical protein Q4P28_00905 [Tissierellia bacterium]|nr:hypothetical protein [Tissierellia bacterium]